MLSAKHHSAKTLVTWDPHVLVIPLTSNLTSRVEFFIIVANFLFVVKDQGLP